MTCPSHSGFEQRMVIGLAGALLLASTGCGLLGESDALFISGVEGLISPAATEAGLYRPGSTFPIDPNDQQAGQAADFFLTFATASPQRLKMRLLRGDGREPMTLQRIDPPPEDTVLSPGGPDISAESRDLLRAGQGVFWLADNTTTRGLYHRAGVALPDSWTQPSVALQVYTATTSSGDPFLPDQIELAHDFLYMAAIGDSVVWGNGLRESQKFSRQVAAMVQQRTARRVVLQVQAISGARIVPKLTDVICRTRCNGEIQAASTSITAQVDLLEAPELLELVLLDGCINDVTLSAILDPATRAEALIERTDSACHDDMLALLRKVRAVAPAACILVTSYFPILSLESQVPEVAQYFLASNVSADPTALGAIAEIVANTDLFFNTSSQALAAAVQDANAEQVGGPGIIFANAGFGPQNALFASQPLLWGLTAHRAQPTAAEEGFTLFPEDPLAGLRAEDCFNDTVPDPILCLYASVGHPNPAGAQRYTDVIVPLLEQLGIIPP